MYESQNKKRETVNFREYFRSVIGGTWYFLFDGVGKRFLPEGRHEDVSFKEGTQMTTDRPETWNGTSRCNKTLEGTILLGLYSARTNPRSTVASFTVKCSFTVKKDDHQLRSSRIYILTGYIELL